MGKFKLLLTEGLHGKIPGERLELLPSGFQRIGDIIVIPLDPQLELYENDIGEFVKKQFKVKSVFRKGVISGVLRKPGMKRIAGKVNITIHKENGCLFKMDVSKLMFSKGNIQERGRIQSAGEEEVVDMFGGIGYFCIPLAKKNPSSHITVIEKNPLAVKFLRENLELNKITNIKVIESDCRDVELACDRVIMGYFPGTEELLPKAFSFLRREGIIHFHNIYRKQDLWRKPLGTLETQALENGYRIRVLYKNIVKQYSPCKYHVVVDIKCVRTR